MSGGRSQCEGCDRAEHVVSPSCPPLRRLDRRRQPASPNAQMAFGVRHGLLRSQMMGSMRRSARREQRFAARVQILSEVESAHRQARILAVGLRARGAADDRQKKWGPALLPAPTAPSEGSAGVRNLVRFCPKAWLTRSRSWLTSSGVAFHPTAPSEEEPDFYWTALPEGSLVFRRPACPLRTQFPNRSPGTTLPAKAVRCSAALLGVTTLASRFAYRSSEELLQAASRERRSPLPAPLPGWPRKEPEDSLHCLPAEIGPLVTCRTFLPLPALWRGRDRRPDHPCTMHVGSESGKRKIREKACG